jgi:hypothetical protein
MNGRTRDAVTRYLSWERLARLAGWAALSALTAIAVYLGSFWFSDSWRQPASIGALAVTLLAGGLVGHRRAADAGSRRWAAAVRYGLLVGMLVASAVAVLLMASTLLLFTILGGWSI